MDINSKISEEFEKYLDKPPFLGVIPRRSYLKEYEQSVARNAHKAGFLAGADGQIFTQKELRMMAQLLPTALIINGLSGELNQEELQELQDTFSSIATKLKAAIHE